MVITVKTIEKSKIARALEIIDAVASDIPIVIAFSGGKDSTTLALLFEEWLKEGGKPRDLYIIHNDTLGEINLIEYWARKFMDIWAKRLSKLNVKPHVIVTTPPPQDTFLWRMIVRGYAAPTFKWRWCVDLLKINPTFRVINNLVDELGEVGLLVGLRSDESSARARAISIRKMESPNKIFANALLNSEMKKVKKISPLIDWVESDVWSYILSKISDFPELKELLTLYWAEGCKAECVGSPASARFGCWFCTVTEQHRGLENVFSLLDNRYLWLEYLRNLMRDVSDAHFLRRKKNWGYSRLGPLTKCGRSIILNAIPVVERASGIRIYSLDESRVNGATLREIFYSLDPLEANQLIRSVDRSPRARAFRIQDIRDLHKVCDREKLEELLSRAREGSEKILSKLI